VGIDCKGVCILPYGVHVKYSFGTVETWKYGFGTVAKYATA